MTEEEWWATVRAEARRFQMQCQHCQQSCVPQTMPFDVMGLVRAFIREHQHCSAERRG